MALTTRCVLAALVAAGLSIGVLRANGVLRIVGGGPDEALGLGYERIETSITDQAATTRVRQRFVNETARVLEGEYEFSLRPGSSISDFAIWDGDRRVAGVMRRREDAQQIYQHIVSRQRDPGLLEQIGEELFRAKVYPIPARDSKRIEVEYREMLSLDSGLVAYRVPLAVARGAGGTIRELVVTVDIRDQLEIQSAWASVPDVAIHHHDKNHVTVSYEVTNVTPRQDLVVFYQVKRSPGGMKLVTHRERQKDGTFMLALCPADEGLPKIPKDVVFVLDTSGSMQGSKIAQAKRALTYCLSTLAADDRFALVRFSTDVDRQTDGLVAASDANVDSSRTWVEGLKAMGGTNIGEALDSAFQCLGDKGSDRPRYIVLLTDGEPTVGDTEPSSICGRVREKNGSRVRLFTFGVDEAAGSKLLATLASENGGEAISVASTEELETQLSVFFGKLTKPLFDKVELDFGGLKVRSVHPRKVPHFYLGRQVFVLGRYESPATGTIVARVQVEGRSLEYRLAASLPETEPANAMLERLWAQREVDYLLAQAPASGLAAELKEEVVRLSIAHTFVTPYTAFIAVPEKEKEMLPPELRRKLEGGDAMASTGTAADPNRGVSSIQGGAEGARAAMPVVPAPARPAQEPAPAPAVEVAPAAPADLDTAGVPGPASSPAAAMPAAPPPPPSGSARRGFDPALVGEERKGEAEQSRSGFAAEGPGAPAAGPMGRPSKIADRVASDELSDVESGKVAGKFAEMLNRQTSGGGGGAGEAASKPDVDGGGYDRDGYDKEGSGRNEFNQVKRARMSTSGSVDRLSQALGKKRQAPGHEVGAVQNASTKDATLAPGSAGGALPADSPAVTESRTDDLMLQPGTVERRNEAVRASNQQSVTQVTTREKGAAGQTLAGWEPVSRPREVAPDAIDERWRQLRGQVGRLKDQVRLIRARLGNLEAALENRPVTSLSPVVERVVLDPPIVRGGEVARISLTVRYPAGARPKISWKAHEGYLVRTHEGAAVWRAPTVPGTYAITVVLTPPGGKPTEETLDLEVFQPGRITYSPAHLDERLTILSMSLSQLKSEHRALADRFAKLMGRAATSTAVEVDLKTAPPTLACLPAGREAGSALIKADLVEGALPRLVATEGFVTRDATVTAAFEAVWKTADTPEWQVASAEWTPPSAFHWLSSVALPAPGRAQAAVPGR